MILNKHKLIINPKSKIMKPTKEQIAEYIKEYLAYKGNDVMNRNRNMMLIHRLQVDRIDESGVPCSKRWIALVEQNIDELKQLNDFDKLHIKVAKLAEKIVGIGPLTVYDTATCIGFERGVFPKQIYLNQGAAAGAKALGIKGRKQPQEVFNIICGAFEQMNPAQIEDFLCIYKSCLQGDEIKCEKVRNGLKNNNVCGSSRGCCC